MITEVIEGEWDTPKVLFSVALLALVYGLPLFTNLGRDAVDEIIKIYMSTTK